MIGIRERTPTYIERETEQIEERAQSGCNTKKTET